MTPTHHGLPFFSNKQKRIEEQRHATEFSGCFKLGLSRKAPSTRTPSRRTVVFFREGRKGLAGETIFRRDHFQQQQQPNNRLDSSWSITMEHATDALGDARDGISGASRRR